MADVRFTLLLTIFLVILVIFLFLRNIPATIIPSLALPMSLIGTFAVMYLLGFSLDNLSLMALTLAVGFVVDDAIVVLENIVRHTELGEQPFDAALEGAKEIGFTIVSMTLSLVAVFIPVLLLQGLIGRLFREFAVTIAVAILVSGFVSLTLTPMLCARFLKPGHTAQHGRFYETTERLWLRLLGAYDRSLTWVMDHSRAALAFSAAILVGTVLLGHVVEKGFIPSEDQGMLFGNVVTREGTSYDAMVRHQQEVARIVQADSNVETFMSSVGSGGRSSGDQRGNPLPSAQGPEQAQARRRCRGARDHGQGVRGTRRPGLPHQSSGDQHRRPADQKSLPVHPAGDRHRRAVPESRRVRGRGPETPGITDVNSDLQIKNPQVQVTIDRDRAAQLGISAEAVQEALYNAYGARQVSTIFTQDDQYWVVMELLPEYQRDLAALNLLSIRSPNGDLVPLTTLAKVAPDVGPLTVNHQGQLPAVTVSFNTAPGVSLGDAVTRVQDLARRTLPSSISTTFAGTAQAFQEAQSGLLILLVLAIVVIYLVLGILYESFVHPITILTGLPFAGFGALLILVITRLDLSIYAFVGIIMLVGLVKKNAIMMIDFAIEAERRDKKSPREAILEACRVRFRPIMMTTMAALMGTLPIALGAGAGAESRRPLGVAVVGGLAFSQLITLYVTPVFYTYFDTLASRVKAWRTRKRAVAVEAHSTAP
mgnify:CR=1 FL=1